MLMWSRLLSYTMRDVLALSCELKLGLFVAEAGTAADGIVVLLPCWRCGLECAGSYDEVM